MAAFEALMVCILRVREVPTQALQTFVHELGPAADDAFMTGAHQLEVQGRGEGKAKGKAEALLKPLSKNFGPLEGAVVERVRAASLDELEGWSSRRSGRAMW
jgi:hypothetical protein